MLKLMKKKAKAEEDAKQWEGELGKANCELRKIRNKLKIARQKLQKATIELKQLGIIGRMSNLRMCCLLYLLFSREWRD
jgi:multidrug resistance efflux pump